MEFKPRPEIPKDAQLNFDYFHPIRDHWPWQCGDLPGGWRTHVKYAWQFYWADEVWRWTWCRVGRHRPVQWWQGDLTWVACLCCNKKFSNRQPG